MSEVVMNNRVLKVLAKNELTVAQAVAMTLEQWKVLVDTAGNGIGKVLVADIALYAAAHTQVTPAKISKADKKAYAIIERKAIDLEQLVQHYIFVKHAPSEVIDKIIKRAKDPKEIKMSRKILEHYTTMPIATRRKVMYKLLGQVYSHTVSKGRRDIIRNVLIASMSGALTDQLRDLTPDWVSRKVVSDNLGGGINKYTFVGHFFVAVILDVLELMRIVNYGVTGSLTSMHQSATVTFASKEFRLDPVEDKPVVKHYIKVNGTEMTQYPLSYDSECRNEMNRGIYSGHSKKITKMQSAATITAINEMQSNAWVLVPGLIDPTTTLGKQVRIIAKKHYEANPSGFTQFCEFLDNYELGTKLYAHVTITPDNGRVDYRGWPVGLNTGALSWIFQSAEMITLTDTEVAKLNKRVDDIQGCGKKLGNKEKMEMFHYMAALSAHTKGEQVGVLTSNDFKGSGPLMQALMSKNTKGLKMSIEYDGKSPSDPYREILGEYAKIKQLGSVEALAEKEFSETVAEIREWTKKHTQPKQYGSGSETSAASGAKVGSRLDQAIFDSAFDKALPHTAFILGLLKERAKYLGQMSSLTMDSTTATLHYTNPAGVHCAITPLSDGKKNEGEGFVHHFNVLGHRMSIPCKIIDVTNHGVKTIAAGSIQCDAGVLWTMYKLFDHQMYSVHDDFRTSIRHEDELQQVAIAVLKMFWEDEQLLNKYLIPVYSSAAEVLGGYNLGVTPPKPDAVIDWAKVTRVLF